MNLRFSITVLLASMGIESLAVASTVGLASVNGTIVPATASYIARAVNLSGERKDACLIIELDTPGGLLDSTEKIVQSFYQSKVPIVVYVSPEGAHATSAGVFITLAADVATMAPNTSMGAAHPVTIRTSGDAEKQDDVMKQKLENFAASYIATIAEKRNRNVEWARAAVIESASVTAEEAVATNVVDFIAKDRADLLQKLDGRTVNDKIISTAGAEVISIPMIAREKVFQMLWRPEVLYILLLVAIYGIIGEVSNPGAILPGVVGVIALILMLYMSAVLPVNIAGFALIGLAIVLFIVDLLTPTHGVLTAGGVISFFLGAFMLFNNAGPAFTLSLAYIIPGVLITAAFFVFVVGAGIRAQFNPVRAGAETMVGQTARALSQIDASGGKVFIEGEYWNAVSENTIEAGHLVEVLTREGLTLKVKAKQT